MSDFQMQTIGWVRGGRAEVEDDDWGSVFSRIELDEHQFGPEAFAGLDAVDGASVLDVKPYFAEFGPRGAVKQPAWAVELMDGYW